MLFAAGAIVTAVIVVVMVFAVAFLVGRLDDIGGLRRSSFHLTSPAYSSNKPSKVHSFRGTENNRGHGAPPRSSPTTNTLFSLSEPTQASQGSGDHKESVIWPSARLYPTVSASVEDEKECKADDRDLHETMRTCQDSCFESVSVKIDTAGGLCSRREDASTIYDAEAPASVCNVDNSKTPGYSTGMAMEHMDTRDADAQGPDDAEGNSNRCFGCCRRFGETTKKWTSRLPFKNIRALVVVWQIITAFRTVTSVNFPLSYQRFLTWIDVVNFDFGQILSAFCLLPSVTFYERLSAMTLAPIVLTGVLLLTYQVAKRKAGIGSRGTIARQVAWSRHMAAGLLLSFLVGPIARGVLFSVCSKYLQEFDTIRLFVGLEGDKGKAGEHGIKLLRFATTSLAPTINDLFCCR